MKKILIIGNASSIHVKRWVNYLDRKKNHIVYVTNQSKNKLKEDSNTIKYINIPKLSNGKIINYTLFLIYVLRALWINNFKIINVQYLGLNSVPALLAANKNKIINTCWGSDIHTDHKRNVFYKMLVKLALKKTKINLFCGKNLLDYALAENLTNDLTRNIYFSLGIDKNIFFNINAHTPDARNIDFIFPRLLRPQYNLKAFLNALRLVNSKGFFPVVYISIAEKDEVYFSQFSEILVNLKNVFLFDKVDQATLASYYNRSKFIVSIPSNEGLGLSVFEAALCGSYPIVSDLPAYRFLLNSNNSIIVNPNDSSNFSELLIKALQNYSNLEFVEVDEILQEHDFENSLKKIDGYFS